MWHYWAHAATISVESTLILWAFVSSEVDLPVAPASGLFLWMSSPPLINPPFPFVGHPTGQPSRRAKSDILFSYFVFLCWPEGMLSSWTKFAFFVFISPAADCGWFGWITTGLSLPCGCEYGCVSWGKCQGLQCIVTSEECIMSSLQSTSQCTVYLSEQCSQCEPAL